MATTINDNEPPTTFGRNENAHEQRRETRIED